MTEHPSLELLTKGKPASPMPKPSKLAVLKLLMESKEKGEISREEWERMKSTIQDIQAKLRRSDRLRGKEEKLLDYLNKKLGVE